MRLYLLITLFIITSFITLHLPVSTGIPIENLKYDGSLGEPGYSIVVISDEPYIAFTPNLLYPLEYIETINIDDLEIGIIDPYIISREKINLIAEYTSYKDKFNLIDRILELGGEIRYIYKYLPFIAFEIEVGKVPELTRYYDPMYINVDYRVTLNLNVSVGLIVDFNRLNILENQLGFDIDGSGIYIAILDTGIDWRHPDFYFPNGTSKIVYNISLVPDEDPYDYYGHGTHVAGIAAGTGLASNGAFKGVAPGALLMNIKVVSREGFGLTSWIIAGIEEAVDKGADVINLSLGGGLNGDGDDPLSRAVDWAVKQDVVVVVAAGNDGPNYSTLGSPAVSTLAITVGAVDKDVELAEFSSRGPTGDVRVKPDVLAPGVDIIAPLARESLLEQLLGDIRIEGDGGDYIPLSGTSMSTPHVAGVAALLKQVRPELNALEIKNLIVSTSDPINTDIFSYGYGLVNTVDALNASLLFSNISLNIDMRRVFSDTYVANITVYDLDGIPTNLYVKNMFLTGFYKIDNNITSMLNVDIIDVNSTVKIVSIEVPIVTEQDLYMGRIIFGTSDQEEYQFIFTAYRLFNVYLNTTYNGEAFFTLFIAYDATKGERWILPTGGRIAEDGESYTLWFKLPYGEYKFIGISLNRFMSEDLIIGPITLITREIILDRDVIETMEITDFNKVTLPVKYRGYDLVPIGHLYGVYTPNRDIASIYQYGIWNTSADYEMYLSLETNDKIYLNIQYIQVPLNISGWNYTEILDYTTTYIDSSWIVDRNIRSLVFPRLTQFTLNTGFQSGNNSYLGGFAIFPPKQSFTLLVLGPAYQGANYRILVSDDIQIAGDTESKYFLTFSSGGVISSLSVLDTTSTSRSISPATPEYFLFQRVIKGLVAGAPAMNITTFLLSDVDPIQIPGPYTLSYKLLYGEDIVESGSSNGLPIVGFDNLRDLDQPYTLIVNISNNELNLFNDIDAKFFINSSSLDSEPPILYNLDLLYIGDTLDFDVSILEGFELDRVNIYISWDGGDYMEVTPTLEGIEPQGTYNRYDYTFTLSVDGSRLDIKIFYIDKSGNYVETIYRDVFKRFIDRYDKFPEFDVYPRLLSGDREFTVEVSSDDEYLYGVSIYVDATPVINVPVKDDIELFKFSRELLGVEDRDVSIFNILISTSPYVPEVEKRVGFEVAYTKYVVSYEMVKDRYGLDETAAVELSIRYLHNNSLAGPVEVVVNGTTYFVDDGILIINVTRDSPGLVTYIVEDVRYFNKYIEVSDYIVPSEPIKILFDSIQLLYTGQYSYRVDISRNVDLEFFFNYFIDSSNVEGYLEYKLNGELKRIDVVDGSATITILGGDVGRYIIELVRVVDTNYNLTSDLSLETPIEIIFDRVVIELSTDLDVAQVGLEVDVEVNAYYEYDGTPFEGNIFIDPFPVTRPTPGVVTVRVSGIVDTKYGFSSFTSNELSIYFDELDFNVEVENGFGYIKISIDVLYEDLGQPVDKFFVDGAEYEDIFVDEATGFILQFEKTYNISVPGFEPTTLTVSTTNVYNLGLIIALTLIGAAIIIFIWRSRGSRV